MRTWAVPAVMTTFVAVAVGLLAAEPETFQPFFAYVPRDARTELPLVASLAVLTMGSAAVGAVARRRGVVRADDVAAAMLAPAGAALAAYLAFVLRTWPAFAANRVTYGFDASHLGWPLAIALLLAHLGLGFGISRGVARLPAVQGKRRGLVGVLVVVTALTALMVGLGVRHLRAHPRGYLGELQRLPLPRLVPPGPAAPLGDLCVFATPDPKKLDVVVVAPGGACPATVAGGERLEAGTVLLHDPVHDAWFGPSHGLSPGEDYRRQLEGPRGILTLHDVGAPPPFGLILAACIALGVSAVLSLEALRGKRPLTFAGVAVVVLFAIPIAVGAAVGVL
jgi:hypothetical protein